MSGEMKLYERTDFLALVPNSDVARAMEMNRDGDEFSEQDLVQVKTPSGGGMFWTIKGATGAEAAAAIEGVIVFRCLKGMLWRSDETSEDKPVLVSDDMKVGRLNIPWDEVPEDMKPVLEEHELTIAEIRADKRFKNVESDDNLPRLFWWDGPNKLPYCEFGSATKAGSKGKRAKDYQILYLLRKNEGLPIRIQLGPTSIQPVRQFFNQMTDVPFVQAVVKLSLKEKTSDSGKKYSIVVMERVGVLPQEVGNDIDEKYRQPIKRAYDAGKLNVEVGIEE